MFDHVFGPHSVQDKFCFIGNADDVIFHGVRQETIKKIKIDLFPILIRYWFHSQLPALVDELDEGQPGVLLQRVLPLLRAQQHDQLYHRLALFKRGQSCN